MCPFGTPPADRVTIRADKGPWHWHELANNNNLGNVTHVDQPDRADYCSVTLSLVFVIGGTGEPVPILVVLRPTNLAKIREHRPQGKVTSWGKQLQLLQSA